MSLARPVVTAIYVEGRSKSEVAREYRVSRAGCRSWRPGTRRRARPGWSRGRGGRTATRGGSAGNWKTRSSRCARNWPGRAWTPARRRSPSTWPPGTAGPRRCPRPGGLAPAAHYRIRHDRIDDTGVITIRHNSRLHHIGIGRAHARTRVLALIADLDIRIINRETGELLRALTLNPAKDYQPQAKKENDVPRHL